MKLEQIYKMAIEKGIEFDPRGRKNVQLVLKRIEEEYKELKKDQQKEFDKEKLVNPYSDTRILYGDPQNEVSRILVGIDMEASEILLADRLGHGNKKIDLVMSHHPEGYALAIFYEVMHMQADILNKFGVPINIAESLLEDRIKEVQRKVMPANHTRAVDVARLLNIPFMCVHTPADNCVTSYLQKLVDNKKPVFISDVLKLLKELPEYKEATLNGAGPIVVVGDEKRKAGKIFVEMTGGTEGAKEIFGKIAQAGIGTLVCMHLDEERIKKVKEEHINVIIAGHIASDNIGLNLMLDEVQKKDSRLEVIPCSGFRRFSRDK